jgi:hypothetical protein
MLSTHVVGYNHEAATCCVVYLTPVLQADLPAYARKSRRFGRFSKGSCMGLRAWAIARLVEVKQPQGAAASSKQRSAKAGASGVPSKVLLQRYYRPEDVSKDTAYK